MSWNGFDTLNCPWCGHTKEIYSHDFLESYTGVQQCPTCSQFFLVYRKERHYRKPRRPNKYYSSVYFIYGTRKLGKLRKKQRPL